MNRMQRAIDHRAAVKEYKTLIREARTEYGKNAHLGDLTRAATLARRAHSAAWRAAETSRNGIQSYEGMCNVSGLKTPSGYRSGIVGYTKLSSSLIATWRVEMARELHERITKGKGGLPSFSGEHSMTYHV